MYLDIITRGKYYPDKSLATDKEPPLYLHVSAATKESLEKAVDKINELIETAQIPVAGSLSDHKNDRRNERRFFEKILPVEVSGTPHFNLRAKIVGPSGAYVKHIHQETGCRIQLKGKGSGFLETNTGKESDEPLHVHLSCAREEGLQAGIKLTQDLLDTVKQEAERGPQYPYGYRGGYNNGGYSSGVSALFISLPFLNILTCPFFFLSITMTIINQTLLLPLLQLQGHPLQHLQLVNTITMHTETITTVIIVSRIPTPTNNTMLVLTITIMVILHQKEITLSLLLLHHQLHLLSNLLLQVHPHLHPHLVHRHLHPHHHYLHHLRRHQHNNAAYRVNDGGYFIIL